MRICLFGTHEESYPRNQIIRKALKRAGIEPIDCHVDIWRKRTHKTDTPPSALKLLVLFFQFMLTYPALLVRYLLTPAHALVLVGYPGHLDVVAIKLLAMLRKKPILFDTFVSLYDSVVLDRQLLRKESWSARILFRLDKTAYRLADRILVDTDAHIEFLSSFFNIPRERFRRLFAGADDELFTPRQPGTSQAASKITKASSFKILFTGKFTPLHGVDTIVEAAQMLREHHDITFDLVGTGQGYEKIKTQIGTLGLTASVHMHGWIHYEDFPKWLAQADLCLGIFADTDKAHRVIPNKIFQAFAMKKPVITAGTTAARELLAHRKNAYLVAPENARELADAILTLKDNPELCRTMASEAYAVFHRTSDIEKTALRLGEIIRETASRTHKAKP